MCLTTFQCIAVIDPVVNIVGQIREQAENSPAEWTEANETGNSIEASGVSLFVMSANATRQRTNEYDATC